MLVINYIITIIFFFLCILIGKEKSYKKNPFITVLIFLCFIGSAVISIMSFFMPKIEAVVLPIMIILLGLIVISYGIYELYLVFSCTQEVNGTYSGYKRLYGATGIIVLKPIFNYTYNGKTFKETTVETISQNKVEKLVNGATYIININKNYPAICCFQRLKKIEIISQFILGILIIIGGILLF